MTNSKLIDGKKDKKEVTYLPGDEIKTASYRRVTKEQIAAAIKGSAGIKIVVAERLQINRATLENHLKKYPDLAEMVVSEKEQALDMAELLVLTNIQIQRKLQQATGEVVDSADAWKLLDKMGWKRGYAFAGNPNSLTAARDAVSVGGRMTIREVVVEIPSESDLPVGPQPISGEGMLIDVDVDTQVEDDNEQSGE